MLVRRISTSAIGTYDQGIALKPHCKTKLSGAKARVEKIAFEGSEPAGMEFADHG